MKKSSPQPQISFDQLEISVINESSGLFLDGPHTTNHWRSVRKETSGWGKVNGASLEEVFSIVKDNDGVDIFQSDKETSS
jgi:hypothetical protein